MQKTNDIVIIGSGGLATEIKCLIDTINRNSPQWNLLGFIDDWGKQAGTEIIDGCQVIGTTEYLNNTDQELFGIIAIGNPQYMKEAREKIHNPLVKFANLIHPSVEMNSANMGHGNIISFGSLISCNVKMGNFNFFNMMCAVGHDVHIGDFNVFNPRTQISGAVHIGDMNFWGMNSSIMQGKKVGNNNKVGASSFIGRDVADHEFLFGIPAKRYPNQQSL